jgi:lysophospholipase L1-like esterase
MLQQPSWPSRSHRFLWVCTIVVMSLCSRILQAQDQRTFTCGKATAASVSLSSGNTYSSATGASAPFGFDFKSVPSSFSGHACSSNAPFFFSMEATEGNYEVTLDLGSDQTSSSTTVRAESRRLVLPQRNLRKGQSERHTFLVHVRTPTISEPGVSGLLPRVKLKSREISALDWDNKLTLEFNGTHPSMRSLSIRRVDRATTIYLAGDSTVVDQDKEPWAAWGQMLPSFFNRSISVANNAESGETIRSFVGENRLRKVMSTIRKGDYLFIQFAHNDQKPGAGFVSIPDYKDELRSYIKQSRDHGATPVLITSMNRRKFDGTGHIEATLAGYPEATRQIAGEQAVSLLDLNAMSKTLFEAMGEDGTLKVFVHYPANTFPGQDVELKDDTHFNSYGAYELARCLIKSIQDQRLPLATYLVKGIPPFDPAHPDPPSGWDWPLSPMISADTPYGR